MSHVWWPQCVCVGEGAGVDCFSCSTSVLRSVPLQSDYEPCSRCTGNAIADPRHHLFAHCLPPSLLPGDLVFVFNFHPTNSHTDYRVGCYKGGAHKVVLSSDEEVFGGWKNVTKVRGRAWVCVCV